MALTRHFSRRMKYIDGPMPSLPPVTLYQPPTRPWGTPNLSPFCSKLECYLRMAKVPHSVAISDMRRAPKGKIPFVSIGDELMGDSQWIIERLESMRDEPMDHWLTDGQRALAHVTRRMIEEGVYFVVMASRWDSEWTSTIQREAFTKVLPGPLKWAFSLIVRDVRKKLRSQGTGRHSREEVQKMGVADFTALSQLLGDNRYFLGDRPSTIDATVFAFVSGAMAFPGASPTRDYVRGQRNLREYEARMKAEYFPELTE